MRVCSPLKAIENGLLRSCLSPPDLLAGSGFLDPPSVQDPPPESDLEAEPWSRHAQWKIPCFIKVMALTHTGTELPIHP